MRWAASLSQASGQPVASDAAVAHWAVEDLLDAHGLRAAFFTGRESQRQRTRNIVDFHDDPATRVLFASDAGGVGLNLQCAATACVNVEIPWNPAVLEQRVGRIYRLGQRRPIDVYNLVSEDSIEERIAGLVADKSALFTGLFESDNNEIRFDRSGQFLSKLERVIQSRETPRSSGIDEEPDEDPGRLDHELDAIVGAADEAQDEVPDEPPPGRTAAGSLPTPGEVRRLFSGMDVQPTASGGVRIETTAEVATTLVTLFQEMARILEKVGSSSATRPGPRKT